MCLHIFFVLLAPRRFFSYHPHLSSLSDTRGIHDPPFFIPLLFLIVPVLSAFLSFTCPNGDLFTAGLSLSICDPNIFYNPRKEGKKVFSQVFVTQPRHQTTESAQSNALQAGWLAGRGVVEIKSERAGILHEKVAYKSQERWRHCIKRGQEQFWVDCNCMKSKIFFGPWKFCNRVT